MATASNSDDSFSCSLCLDIFDKPRVLFCGHSFCSKCLQNYISNKYSNNDKKIICPFCIQKVPVPNRKKPVDTWAAQFPINKSLQDAASDRQQPNSSKKGGHISVLSSVTDSMKSFKEILQTEMDEKIEQLRQAVDISVVDTTEEVRRIGDTLIMDFADAVHKEQDRLKREIEKSQNIVNTEIDKLFTTHRHLIDENERMIKLGEDLLKRKSESDIKINIKKFTKLQNITSDFLSKSVLQIEKAEFKINLIKSYKKREMSVHIGEISTNIQQNTHIDRQKDTLKHTETIDTKTQEDKSNPCLVSILVSGENKSKIVVSDYNNSCVKCFSLERKSLINRYVTSSPPYGLAESRDLQGNVLVVALSGENKILFLNLKKFKLIKRVGTNKSYEYVAVLPGNRFAVVGGYEDQYLDILADSGQIIDSISADLISEPYSLTLQDQCQIVVSDVNKVYCVTSSGDVKWESRDSDRLRDLRDVTCDSEGNIFVCSEDRNCVVQLSRDGNITRDILTDQDGLSRPLTVCCDDNKLYVGELNTGKIKIFTWSKK